MCRYLSADNLDCRNLALPEWKVAESGQELQRRAVLCVESAFPFLEQPVEAIGRPARHQQRLPSRSRHLLGGDTPLSGEFQNAHRSAAHSANARARTNRRSRLRCLLFPFRHDAKLLLMLMVTPSAL